MMVATLADTIETLFGSWWGCRPRCWLPFCQERPAPPRNGSFIASRTPRYFRSAENPNSTSREPVILTREATNERKTL